MRRGTPDITMDDGFLVPAHQDYTLRIEAEGYRCKRSTPAQELKQITLKP